MNTTTTIELVKSFWNTIDVATKKIYQMLWTALLSFLVQHWIVVLIVLVAILGIAIMKALLGRWGMLGSVLYNYLYFGILFIVGLIFGSDIFVNNWFSVACTLALYPICYAIVGIILEKTGLHRRKY